MDDYFLNFFNTTNNIVRLFYKFTKIFDGLFKSSDFLFVLSFYHIYPFILAHYWLEKILFYHTSFSLIIDLYVLIPQLLPKFLILTELVNPTGIPSKRAKAEIEAHPVIVEATIRECSV